MSTTPISPTVTHLYPSSVAASSVAPNQIQMVGPKIPTTNAHLLTWVNEMAALCKPDRVVWVDGSEEEKKRLTDEAVAAGVIEPLNQDKLSGCYLHRSNPNDVAR